MKLEFPPGFDYVKKAFEDTKIWEPRTTEWLTDYLKPGMTFVDVGAQVGYYSVLAAKLGARVFSFEPSSFSRALLEKNLAQNDCENVRIFPLALSDKNGKATLFTGRTPGENSLMGQGVGEEVQTVRFDDLNLKLVGDICLKMDIEGGEPQALAGMHNLLSSDRKITIIIEDWFGHNTDFLIDTYGFKLAKTERAYGNRILIKNQKYEYKQEPLCIHLLGTFNSPCSLQDEGIGNAFASKCVRMARILKMLGHTVIFYGVEGSEVECDEFVQCSTKEVLEKAYGKWDKTKVYGCVRDDLAHRTFNENAIREINKRRLFGDFLLCCHGSYHKPIADAVNIADTVEIGIGYTGSFAKFRIFESRFQMNWSYGAEGKGDGNFYDEVIPGYFDPDDFTYNEEKEDYFLYLGRIITRKGVLVARDVCKKLGKKLVVAGFGTFDNSSDAATFKEITEDPNIEYVGFAGREKRRELLSKAKALFAPTLYFEPFGYVVLEAAFSGTSVITTDFGAFPETILDRVTGFRCKTFAEFVHAAENVGSISPKACRDWAMENFTLEVAAKKYENYFNRILDLYGKGWYAER